MICFQVKAPAKNSYEVVLGFDERAVCQCGSSHTCSHLSAVKKYCPPVNIKMDERAGKASTLGKAKDSKKGAHGRKRPRPDDYVDKLTKTAQKTKRQNEGDSSSDDDEADRVREQNVPTSTEPQEHERENEHVHDALENRNTTTTKRTPFQEFDLDNYAGAADDLFEQPQEDRQLQNESSPAPVMHTTQELEIDEQDDNDSTVNSDKDSKTSDKITGCSVNGRKGGGWWDSVFDRKHKFGQTHCPTAHLYGQLQSTDNRAQETAT
jgi:hypothetical protein